MARKSSRVNFLTNLKSGWEPVRGGGACLAAAACSRKRRRTSRRQLARQGSGDRGTIRENWWFENGLDDCDDGNDGCKDGDWIVFFFILTNKQVPWPWPQLFCFYADVFLFITYDLIVLFSFLFLCNSIMDPRGDDSTGHCHGMGWQPQSQTF